MRLFVLPDDYAGQPSVHIDNRRSHYLKSVLRLREGDRFLGVDPQGRRVALRVAAYRDEGCDLAVDMLSDATPDRGSVPDARITLYQCVPKGKKLDLILRQATEAGVQRIVPVFSHYSVPRFAANGFDMKRERLLRVMREATQQSGTPRVPELGEPIDIAGCVADWNNRGIGLVFYEKPLANKTLHEYLFPNCADVAIVIGPEGGLAQQEIEQLTSAGFFPVFLGDNILRVETAALYAISAVRIVLRERTAWKLRER